MPRRIAHWVNQKMPTRQQMEESRMLRPISRPIMRAELWRFTRRSVPRGVALGMLAAFLIPLGQIFLAVFLAVPFRGNVPIAALATFITNPFTYPFWAIAANKVGIFVLRIDEITRVHALSGHVESGLGPWLSWFLEVAAVTAFGFVVLAVVFASIGYVVSSFSWRWWIMRKRKGKLAAYQQKLTDNSEGRLVNPL